MKKVREVMNRLAVEHDCSLGEIYEQLDYCIDAAIEAAFFSENEYAISFWEELSKKKSNFSVEDVILAICCLIQQESGAVSEGNDSTLM